MTHLRRIMLEELQRRNYADSTARYYLRSVEQFARHFGKSPDKLGLEHLRIALLYPDLALDNQQLIPGLTSFYQNRDRFMHHRTLAPVPEPHSISIDPRLITASA